MSVTASPGSSSSSSSRSLSRVICSRKDWRRSNGGAATASGAVQRRDQVFEVPDAVLGGFLILLGTAQLGEVADLFQEPVGERLQGVRVVREALGVQESARAFDEVRRKLSMLSRVLRLEGGRHRRVLHDGEDGHLRSWLAPRRRSMVTSLSPRAGTLAMRSRLTSSFGLIRGLEVGEEVADFAPVKEALAADEVVAHAGLAQGGFQRARLGVGAKENRLVRPRARGWASRAYSICSAMVRASSSSLAKACSDDLRPWPFCDQSFLPRRRTLCVMMALAALRMVLVER